MERRMPQFVLDVDEWPAMPDAHRSFLRSAITKLQEDDRIVGVAAGGSFVSGRMDEFSDLDLVVVAAPGASGDLIREGPRVAARLGPLLSSFPGDHVGEPR